MHAVRQMFVKKGKGGKRKLAEIVLLASLSYLWSAFHKAVFRNKRGDMHATLQILAAIFSCCASNVHSNNTQKIVC